MINQIQNLLKLRGLSWSKLEEIVRGKNQNRIKREISPKCEELERIAKALDCTIVLIPNEFINDFDK